MLRFTHARRPVELRHDDGVRAWLRRPDLLRVETLDGQLVRVVHEPPRGGAVMTFAGTTSAPPAAQPRPARPEPDIRLDDDGLLRSRRDVWSRTDHDAPMFSNYNWVALFDPVELADGDHGAGTVVDDVTLVDHHGRQALEAVLEPTDAYRPRCDCCALLFSAIVDRRLAESGMTVNRPADFTYPTASRVRLDVGTGVCVHIEEIGGSRAGRGHDLHIEAVDEAMPDDGL